MTIIFTSETVSESGNDVNVWQLDIVHACWWRKTSSSESGAIERDDDSLLQIFLIFLILLEIHCLLVEKLDEFCSFLWLNAWVILSNGLEKVLLEIEELE